MLDLLIKPTNCTFPFLTEFAKSKMGYIVDARRARRSEYGELPNPYSILCWRILRSAFFTVTVSWYLVARNYWRTKRELFLFRAWQYVNSHNVNVAEQTAERFLALCTRFFYITIASEHFSYLLCKILQRLIEQSYYLKNYWKHVILKLLTKRWSSITNDVLGRFFSSPLKFTGSKCFLVKVTGTMERFEKPDNIGHAREITDLCTLGLASYSS